MEKLAISIVLSTTSILNRQKDVTRFLEIPIDGEKLEVVNKLKEKGFVPCQGDDILEGKFKGSDVYLYIATNDKDKVCRIIVRDKNFVGEEEIKERFNTLCNKFKYSSHYISFMNYNIPKGENISYEMSENKKKYRAIFFQTLQKSDILKIDSEIKSKISEICVEKGERTILEKECNKFFIKYLLGLLLKKSVKIAISESNGQYCITMYYDNVYNQTNGEDL